MGEKKIKRWKRECNVCKLGRRRSHHYIITSLHQYIIAICFAHCWVDFAGPFVINLTKKVTVKRYLCLFTCASTRAVHLEIAYSLDTASFLNAFFKMVARCGKPEVMISDNGTNFTSAERELRDLVSTLGSNSNQRTGSSWRKSSGDLIPPVDRIMELFSKPLSSLLKKTLRAILGESRWSKKEFLNSCQLINCSNDPNDDHVLTPNHFQYAQMGGQLAPMVIDDPAFNPRNRWWFTQSLVTKCWRRLMKQYLSTLNTRNKWVEEKRNIAPDDLVLMVILATHEGIGIWVEFKRFFLALTGESELSTSEQQAKIMYDQSQSCVHWGYKKGRKEQNTVLFKGKDVTSNARSLTLTPSFGTGEQNTACFNLVLTN